MIFRILRFVSYEILKSSIPKNHGSDKISTKMNISTIQSPENTLGILFEDVQLSTLFPDSKTFTDCVPKRDYQAILSDYLLKKTTKDFDLEGFIVENFIIPKPKNSHFVSDTSRSVEQHIEQLWAYLTREPLPENGTLIDLPNQYVVPGGRFQEIYYWDSYFTMLGLIGKHTDLVECMIDNFAFLIDTFGYIPNGNRSYFLGRSQPPFFALMVTLLADEKGEEFLLKYLPQLAKEYIFWMKGSEGLSIENQAVNRVIRLHDGSVLNRYWDENDTPRPESYREDVELAHANPQPEIYRHIRAAAESGWDFSSRWFADEQNMASIQTTNIIPVDLNCLLLNLEKTLLKCYQLTDNQAETKQFEDLITQRETAIQTYCWNEKNIVIPKFCLCTQGFRSKIRIAFSIPARSAGLF